MAHPKRARRKRSSDVAALFLGVELDSSTSVPKYAQLEAVLRQRIASGALRPGDRVPPEQDMAAYFSVSRVTIRTALQALARDGLVERCRGRGTTVRPPKIEVRLARPGSFSETLKGMGFQVRDEVVLDEVAGAPDAVAKEMSWPIGADVWVLERTRYLNDECLATLTHYLPADYRPRGNGTFRGSLYRHLDSQGARPVLWSGRVEAVRAEPPIPHKLGVPAGTALLRRVSLASLPDGRHVEYTVGHYRGDRYSYTFESEHAAHHG